MSGLEDVVAADSAICDVDGKNGRLIYRGFDIHDLAEHSTFEEVVYLLWFGKLPLKPELESFSK
jgi:citrate synthase